MHTRPLFITSCLVALAMAGFSTSQVQAAITVGNRLLIDFGVNTQTVTSPDSNGNHWNNASGAINTAGGGITPAAVNNMVTTANVATGVNMTFSSGWNINNPGGLTTPSSILIGDLAVANATSDFYYIQGGVNSATITLTNLDPALTYNFDLFATRNATDIRVTNYAITDVNGLHTVDLQTSGTGAGTGAYQGNDDTIAQLYGIVPTSGGVVTLTVNRPNSFAYIDAIGITAVPEPATFGLVGLAVSLLGFRRRR
jgi:PEP-CTERM motif